MSPAPPKPDPARSLYGAGEFSLDPVWYAAQYPEAVLAVQRGEFSSLAAYQVSVGEQRLNNPSPLFSSRYYAQVSGYRQRSPKWGLVEDYFRWGANNGHAPHWLFSEEFAKQQEPRLRAAIESNSLTGSYIFYLRQGTLRNLRPHPLFCGTTLSKSLPGVDPQRLFAEFLRKGPSDDLSPGPLFDPSWYGGRYTDLKGAIGPGMPCETLLQHFCEFGIDENRAPVPDFDVEHYVRQCLRAGALDHVKGFKAVRHFLMYGIASGLDPNRFFSTQYYLENNPEVVTEVKELGFLGPFEHFLALGMQRKLRASPPLVQLAVEDDSAKALFEKRARFEASQLTLGKPIELQSPDQPHISAVVPVFNNFNYTAWLLRQLHDYQLTAPSVKIEVIVVDDGSSDRTRELERFVGGIKLIRLPGGAGYPGACNAGARIARGDVVVFLNNDIEILRGTFEAALRVLQDSTVGAVGGRIIKLNGVLQEAGGLVFQDGSAAGYGRGQDPLRAKFMAPRDVDYCSGCFLGVRRAILERIGGFDEQYSPGYYEDTDLCARIWDLGLRVRYDPGVAINHYEYASFSKGRPETISTALMARNRDLFRKRNAAFLAKQPPADIERIDTLAFWRNGTNRHVVLVEDFVPGQAIGSGFGRSSDIVDGFLAMGWRVTLWVLYKRAGIEARDENLCETLFEPEYPGGLKAFLERVGPSVDLFWVCRTHNFRRVGEMIQDWRAKLPPQEQPRVVYDTEAIASVRTWLTGQLALGDSVDLRDLPRAVPKELVKRELHSAQRADALILVNDIDHRLASAVVDCPTAILGLCFEARPTPAGFDERKGLLFVGAVHEAGSPNYDSLVWFCNKIMPLLRDSMPDVQVKIVGYWKSDVPVPDSLRVHGVEIIGPVENLTPYFEEARVFIAPTRVAAGVPHKVQQAMALGLPAVLTPILTAQLADLSTEGEIAFGATDFTAPAFANAILHAYSDRNAWELVRAAALAAIRTHSSPAVFTRIVDELASVPAR